jgi:hypothetical protein
VSNEQTMTSKGHLEPIAGVLRLGGRYREPYTWCCTVRWIDPQQVELLGAITAPKPEQWHAIAEVLSTAGVETVLYQRADGRQRAYRIPRQRDRRQMVRDYLAHFNEQAAAVVLLANDVELDALVGAAERGQELLALDIVKRVCRRATDELTAAIHNQVAQQWSAAGGSPF